jgi:hypothetical protein
MERRRLDRPHIQESSPLVYAVEFFPDAGLGETVLRTLLFATASREEGRR